MLNVSALLERMAGRKVYFDTNVFIYVLNDTQPYSRPCLALLQACADRSILGLTGDVTFAELLVKPLQTNDAAAVAAVRELLVDDGAITVVGHDRQAFEAAAALRARHGMKMVDALQLATGRQAGAACLISNDRQFPTLPDIECLTLAG